MTAIAEPAQRLAPQARWAWRLSWSASCLAALVVFGMAGGGLPGPWYGIGMAVLGVALVVGTAVVPELRWRRWRWEVREHEIDVVDDEIHSTLQQIETGVEKAEESVSASMSHLFLASSLHVIT